MVEAHTASLPLFFLFQHNPIIYAHLPSLDTYVAGIGPNVKFIYKILSSMTDSAVGSWTLWGN